MNQTPSGSQSSSGQPPVAGSHDPELLRAKLNGETARIRWAELASFHAQGKVMAVSRTLDLVEVAAAVAEDNSARVKEWLEEGSMLPVSESQASDWQAQEVELWAVVVAPWVLVQPEQTGDAS